MNFLKSSELGSSSEFRNFGLDLTPRPFTVFVSLKRSASKRTFRKQKSVITTFILEVTPPHHLHKHTHTFGNFPKIHLIWCGQSSLSKEHTSGPLGQHANRQSGQRACVHFYCQSPKEVKRINIWTKSIPAVYLFQTKISWDVVMCILRQFTGVVMVTFLENCHLLWSMDLYSYLLKVSAHFFVDK